MNYLSVCSGIGAAELAWQALGWRCAAVSEIAAFPRAVLEHRLGAGTANGPALHGDFTTIEGDEYGPIDLLVGGTPCQSFSIAGLRGGLDDDRGNLALEFLRLAQRTRARWLVWENVPGVVSVDGGDALTSILDGMEELGYIVDIDILDAQFFGVAQRRRRVFICGQHRDDLLKTKTHSSALTIAQCLVEILHGISVEASSKSESGRVESVSAGVSADGARRRMRLFGIIGDEACNFERLLEHLDFLLEPLAPAPENSGFDSAGETKPTAADQSTDSTMELPSLPIAESWKSDLAESYEVMKSFITSTPTSRTIDRTIFTCSKAVGHIADLIWRSNTSSPPFWSAASSAFVATREFTNYARCANSSLFTDSRWVRAWGDFIGEAERTSQSLGNIGIRSFGEIFPISESLSGNSAPRRQAGEGIARDTGGGPDGGRVSGTVSSKWHKGSGGPSGDEAYNLIAFTAGHTGESRGQDPVVAHALRGEGFDANEDGTGRGTPLVPVHVVNGNSTPETMENCAFPLRADDGSGNRQAVIAFTAKDHGGDAQEGVAPTLRAGGHTGSHANAGVMPAVAFDMRGREGGAMPEGPHDTANIRAASGGSSRSYVAFDLAQITSKTNRSNPMPGDPCHTLHSGDTHHIATPYAVRRLTPVECERLQFLPDNWTQIPWRGKPAEECPDGPRYKGIGNSMAGNCMRWLGRRIDAVEAIQTVTP